MCGAHSLHEVAKIKRTLGGWSTHTCPTEAMLSGELSDAKLQAALDKLCRSVFLSNEHAFIRQTGRIAAGGCGKK